MPDNGAIMWLFCIHVSSIYSFIRGTYFGLSISDNFDLKAERGPHNTYTLKSLMCVFKMCSKMNSTTCLLICTVQRNNFEKISLEKVSNFKVIFRVFDFLEFKLNNFAFQASYELFSYPG